MDKVKSFFSKYGSGILWLAVLVVVVLYYVLR